MPIGREIKTKGIFWSMLPLLIVQFFATFNDNLVRNALLILIAFAPGRIFPSISNPVLVNLSVFVYILPFLMFSSYAGKLADTWNKILIIRWVKILELLIVIITSYGLMVQNYSLLLFTLFALGTHSAFFGPIKYSIISQYYADNEVGVATGYVELGIFVSILLGQTFGSWAMSSSWVLALVITLIVAGIIGVYYSFKLKAVPIVSGPIKYYLNPFKDAWEMYKRVTLCPSGVRLNLHAIGWFWALGLINTTEFSLFTAHYLGGDGHVFSVTLALTAFGIGIGSLLCAKFSKGKVCHKYVIYGALGVSLMIWVLLFTHRPRLEQEVCWDEFIQTPFGILSFCVIFIKGIAAGFYSLTCYTELQLMTASNLRSQVIAANNILSSFYLILTAVICAELQTVMHSWHILFITSLVNIGFALIYGLRIRKMQS